MKDCDNCVNLECDSGACLGHDLDKYEYKLHIPGDRQQAIREAEQSGAKNIVIGGQGEAEVNVKWTYSETLTRLQHVAECCGYSVSKQGLSGIEVCTPEGHFLLDYMHGRLWRIYRITEKTIWEAK